MHWDLSGTHLAPDRRGAIEQRLEPGTVRRRNGGRNLSRLPVFSQRARPGEALVTSMPPGSFHSARWCIGFPARRVRSAPRSAWMLPTCSVTAAAFQLSNSAYASSGALPPRCAIPGRDGNRPPRQFVVAHDPPNDRPARRYRNRAAQPVWRQPRSRRAPARALARGGACPGRRDGRRGRVAYVLGASLSCVFVSKSLASWRSCNCMAGSPLTRLTMRPLRTAGR